MANLSYKPMERIFKRECSIMLVLSNCCFFGPTTEIKWQEWDFHQKKSFWKLEEKQKKKNWINLHSLTYDHNFLRMCLLLVKLRKIHILIWSIFSWNVCGCGVKCLWKLFSFCCSACFQNIQIYLAFVTSLIKPSKTDGIIEIRGIILIGLRSMWHTVPFILYKIYTNGLIEIACQLIFL